MLTIRTAHREDAPLLSEMGNASYRHHFAPLWHSASELAHFLQQEYSLPALHRNLADERSCWLIAEARHPVGFAKYSCHQPMASDGPRGTLLHKLYLLPTETGHGYGEQIFSALKRGQRRRVTTGCGWKSSPATPAPGVFMSVQVCNM